MTYSAKVKFTFVNDTPPQYSQTFPELLDEHSITIEAPAQDLNIHQYFSLFKSFLRAIDFSEYSIMDGACGVAFNGSNKEEDMSVDTAKLMMCPSCDSRSVVNEGGCLTCQSCGWSKCD